jgi:hypothetical protein
MIVEWLKTYEVHGVTIYNKRFVSLSHTHTNIYTHTIPKMKKIGGCTTYLRSVAGTWHGHDESAFRWIYRSMVWGLNKSDLERSYTHSFVVKDKGQATVEGGFQNMPRI